MRELLIPGNSRVPSELGAPCATTLMTASDRDGASRASSLAGQGWRAAARSGQSAAVDSLDWNCLQIDPIEADLKL